MVRRFDRDGDSTPWIEITFHHGLFGFYRPYDVIENHVHNLFMKRVMISVRKKIKLEGFALEAEFIRDIADCYLSEVGLTCYRTQGSEFRTIKVNPVTAFSVGVPERLKSGL